MSKSTLNLTSLTLDDSGQLISLSSVGSDTLDFEGLAGADITLTGITNIFTDNIDTQDITRPTDANPSTLWSDGAGTITIGSSTSPIITSNDTTIQGRSSRTISETTITTAANTTYTSTEIYDGLIRRDCNGDDRTDTLPTAANIVAEIEGAVVGSAFKFTIINTSDDIETITLSPGTGVTLEGLMVISVNTGVTYIAICDNVTPTSEAVTVYSTSSGSTTGSGRTILLQGSFIDIATGTGATKFIDWGIESNADVDAISLGSAGGTITQVVFNFTANVAIGIGAGEQLAFSIGTANATLTTFTPYTGGTDIVIWDNAVDGTRPVTSSGLLSIPITGTDRISLRSIETGSVTPTGAEIRVQIFVDLS